MKLDYELWSKLYGKLKLRGPLQLALGYTVSDRLIGKIRDGINFVRLKDV